MLEFKARVGLPCKSGGFVILTTRHKLIELRQELWSTYLLLFLVRGPVLTFAFCQDGQNGHNRCMIMRLCYSSRRTSLAVFNEECAWPPVSE
jgi:hypothetical protein